MVLPRPVRRPGSPPPVSLGLRGIAAARARPLRACLVAALQPREPSCTAGGRTRLRTGQRFEPGGQDPRAWRRLRGRRVRLGYDLPASEHGEVPLVGVVRSIRVENGYPLLAIEAGASRILVDPRWWRIVVVDSRCSAALGTVSSWIGRRTGRSVSERPKNARRLLRAARGIGR